MQARKMRTLTITAFLALTVVTALAEQLSDEANVTGAREIAWAGGQPPPPPLAIDGVVSGGLKWARNGTPLPNNSSIDILPGQTLTFGAKSGRHGITFMDKATAQAVFDFGTSASAFKAQPNVGPTAWGVDAADAPAVLATITVKSGIPSTITNVKFQCTLHTTAMAGTFQIQPGSPPPPPAAPLPLAIDGVVSGGPKWARNGTALPNNSSIDISSGQTLTFGVKSGTHGITFMDKTTAQAVFDFGASAAKFKAQPSVGPNAWGVDASDAVGVLATITVKSNVPPTTSVAFQCTFHKTAMAGTFKIKAGG